MVVSSKKRFLEMPMFNDDGSISKDSVFDWGSLPSSGSRAGLSTLTSMDGRTTAKKNHSNGIANNNGSSNKPASRYDPNTMTRITDITDLVDDSEDSDDDDAEAGTKTSMEVTSSADDDTPRGCLPRREEPMGLRCRQALIIMALVGIIAGASLAIGIAVARSDPSKAQQEKGDERASHAPYQVAYEKPNGEQPQQQLLELAERVVTACSETNLDKDLKECQKLCHENLCCFQEGEYSCKEDADKDCGVYAGCEALVEGMLMDGAEEDEGILDEEEEEIQKEEAEEMLEEEAEEDQEEEGEERHERTRRERR